MKRSAIKAKRETPRRNDGRIAHERMKPKAKSLPNAVEKQHMGRLAALGCLVCGKPPELHHVMSVPDKVRRRDHRFVAPLCAEHHRGNSGVHGLGSEKAFLAHHGIDLVRWAQMAWEITQRLLK